MELLRFSSAPPLLVPPPTAKNQLLKPSFLINPNPSSSSPLFHKNTASVRLCAVVSSAASTESESTAGGEDNAIFDWYSQWYPIMPVSDLDKRIPHAKKVMGLDVVVWWDRNEDAWKVFDDMCPHRLAPLSEGRIDQWGRLQCVYHGWCFNGAGDCKFIPQAPPDRPPVHTSKKACAKVYPSIVQNEIVWFWPSTDPQFLDILTKKKPPYIPEFDDPIYTNSMNNRDLPYGYEVLIENFMDPAHGPYAHYGILPQPKHSVKADREGGRPLKLDIVKEDINGFSGKQEWGTNKFIAPCIFCAFPNPAVDKGKMASQGSESLSSGAKKKESVQAPPRRNALLIFICVPVSPGKSRLIWTFPRNYGSWMNRIVPRWVLHINQNLLLDSDLRLLHLEERKLMNNVPSNWQKSCFTPTKSDTLVIGFRSWLNKYSNGQVDWRGKHSEALPQTPPREQLLDRYWSHVVNCRSCSAAHKALKALEIVLQLVSLALIGVIAVLNQQVTSTVVKALVVSTAIFGFAASKWLSDFIYRNFHFHDYNHALV